MPQRNIFTIFLASPGDLLPEREAAREVVQRLNRFVVPHVSWQLDLLAWEDTSPGYARPQEKINADVDKCDLFIGLLWKRWGQPTGTHASGFQEEFERALRRRRETGKPEIWLFFKRIPEDQLSDPGEQLRQVLSFRRLQEEQKELLYQEVVDIKDWERKVYDWLADYALQLDGRVEESSESSTPVQQELSLASTPPQPSEKDEAAAVQITQTLSSFSGVIRQSMRTFQAEAEVDRFLIARLNLFSASWLSENYSHDTLGVHEANLLYQYRDRLQPSHPERLMLLRTVLANSEVTAPGWYWFQGNKVDYLFFLVELLALRDSSAEIRRCALKFLAALKRTPDVRVFKRREYLASVLEAEPRAAADYLSSIGNMNDIGLLGLSRTGEAIAARISILSRHRPNEALGEILDGQFNPSWDVIENLRANADKISKELILRSLSSRISSIRLLAFGELEARGDLTLEQAKSALGDSSRKIRFQAVEWLIEHGASMEPDLIRDLLKRDEPSRLWLLSSLEEVSIDPEAMVRLYFSRLSFDSLEKRVTWSSLDGAAAYQVLSELHFDNVGNQVREDIGTGFSRIKESWELAIRSVSGSEAEQFISEMAKLDSFIRGRFAIAALSGLAKNGNQDDLPAIRSYLTGVDPFVMIAAVEALGSIGTKQDVGDLLNIALNGPEIVRRSAAEAAASLAPGIDGPASDLLASDNLLLITVGLRALEGEKFGDISQTIESLLLHPQDAVRERALALLVKKGSRKYLEDLLARYMEKESYFYNVVGHLDRILYAPRPARSHFRNLLVISLTPGSASSGVW